MKQRSLPLKANQQKLDSRIANYITASQRCLNKNLTNVQSDVNIASLLSKAVSPQVFVKQFLCQETIIPDNQRKSTKTELKNSYLHVKSFSTSI